MLRAQCPFHNSGDGRGGSCRSDPSIEGPIGDSPGLRIRCKPPEEGQDVDMRFSRFGASRESFGHDVESDRPDSTLKDASRSPAIRVLGGAGGMGCAQFESGKRRILVRLAPRTTQRTLSCVKFHQVRLLWQTLILMMTFVTPLLMTEILATPSRTTATLEFPYRSFLLQRWTLTCPTRRRSTCPTGMMRCQALRRGDVSSSWGSQVELSTSLAGNQVEERSPQDAPDGESVDDIGGHSDVEVRSDPISTSQVPETRWTGSRPVSSGWLLRIWIFCSHSDHAS